jgi:hypothetical protein
MAKISTTGNSRSALFLFAMPALFATCLLAGCASPDSPPQQVQSSNPNVTYRYRGDNELLQADQKANAYCSQYHSIAQTANIKTESDGSKTVVFDCVASATTVVPATQPLGSNMAYSYTTDQDLLVASQNAQTYCQANGSQRAVTTTVMNTDGTKSLSFQCVPQ